jgi:hypothetical protein
MRTAPLFLVVLALGTVGFAKKQTIGVRFHVEANENEGQPFATPVAFHHPERKGYIKQVPFISERNIEAIFPYPASDGSFGCAFKLDNFGRTSLEETSLSNRGASVVAFVGTKSGTHQVIDMVIDKVIRDGIITIPSGLTQLEVDALTKEFKVLGETGKKKRK